VRHHPLLSVFALATVAAVTRCTAMHPAVAQPLAADGAVGSDMTPSTTGTVVETMNTGPYTYVRVDDGSKKIWAAAPQFAVAVGDKVVVPSGMAMRDFESKTLGRTFELVSFVSAIQVVSGGAADGRAAAAHGAPAHSPPERGMPDHGIPGHAAVTTTPVAVDLSNIKKADGGQTVAELFANKVALVGKDVVVRGRVVKFTPAVMGKNWMHVQDGSGAAGSNDLTVSTGATAAVGNTVLVHGKLGTDKDLGFGYHYDIIIEDGTVTVE
jgi:hypothetical protein